MCNEEEVALPFALPFEAAWREHQEGESTVAQAGDPTACSPLHSGAGVGEFVGKDSDEVKSDGEQADSQNDEDDEAPIG